MMKIQAFNTNIHPIWDTMRFPFATPAISKLKSEICLWANSGITGGVVLGDGRTGKSISIGMIKEAIKLNNTNQTLPSITYRAKKRDKRTIAQCYRNLYRITGEKDKKGYSVEDMMDQIVCYILDLAAMHSNRQVLLFVDEFQRMTLDQLIVFAELQDELLGDYKALLNVFLFGNTDESDHILEQVKTPQYNFLQGRFFIQKYVFRGITNKDELSKCLRQYDTLRFPDIDGPTYTEHFLPEAFKSGWRLENLADLIWKTYLRVKKPERRTSWGMKYFTGTIAPLLSGYLKKEGVNRVNEAMVYRAIQASGLITNEINRVR